MKLAPKIWNKMVAMAKPPLDGKCPIKPVIVYLFSGTKKKVFCNLRERIPLINTKQPVRILEFPQYFMESSKSPLNW